MKNLKKITETALLKNLNEKQESLQTNNASFFKVRVPSEKDKIKVLNSNFEKDGINKNDEGELFLVDNKDKRVFAIFFDNQGFCRGGQTMTFDDFVVTEPYDDYAEMLKLLVQ